jgi:assimilatory nitrate reductase catalytic subunit
MLTHVARRLGHADRFAYEHPADVFREHAALSGFENDGARLFDIGALGALSDDAFDALEPTQWPRPRETTGSATRLFGQGRFSTNDRRARFVATRWRAPAELTDETRPLLLNTGRVRDQWHTMTRTGRVPRLMQHVCEPLLDLHSADAARLGLVDGALARVASRHAETVLRVHLSPDMRPGEAFATMHWTDRFGSAGPIDRLVGNHVDPISGQPELKATPVAVTAIDILWRGLLLRPSEAPLTGDFHWSRLPIEQGQALDLAGWTALPSGVASERWVMDLLGADDDAELIIYADPRRGTFRYANIVDGRLDACLFLARGDGVLPDRASLAALLGTPVEADGRAALLAGMSGPRRVDPGRIVCACFGVGLKAIDGAIRDRRLTTAAEIGEALRAGTNCGSCLPELKQILRAVVDADAPA